MLSRLKALWLKSLHIDYNTPLWPVYRARLTVLSLVIAATLVMCVVILLAGCGLTSPIQYRTPGGGLFVNSIKTLPTSRHITGLPYPRSCTLGSKDGHPMPDKVCTPGAADAEVIAPSLGNPGNLKGTICTPDWAQAAAAPPRELMPLLDTAQAAYNVRVPNGGAVKLDHLVPPSLGGSNDASNLWPMPLEAGIVDAKANVDAVLNKAVCAGTISLGAAQNAIANNWMTALQVNGLG